jgi:hypothetical protein
MIPFMDMLARLAHCLSEHDCASECAPWSYYGALEHHTEKQGHEGEEEEKDQCEQVCKDSQSKSWTVWKRR